MDYVLIKIAFGALSCTYLPSTAIVRIGVYIATYLESGNYWEKCQKGRQKSWENFAFNPFELPPLLQFSSQKFKNSQFNVSNFQFFSMTPLH
jgi:hypothetical protein